MMGHNKAKILECGGKRSATPLSLRKGLRTFSKSGVAAALCQRTPYWCAAALTFFSVLFAACGRSAPSATSVADSAVEVTTVRPHRGEIYRSIDLPGEVAPLFHVTLFAKVDGYLKVLTVDKGDSVKTGDLIAEIDAPDLRANHLRFKAELELAEAEFQQISQAPTNNPVNASKQEMQAARNRIAVGSARVSSARARLEAAEVMEKYTRILAPFDGIITKRFVDPGAYIPIPNAADTPEAAAIVNVTDYGTLRMQVAVPENEVRHIKIGQPIRWTTDALPGEVFDGNVTRAYWALDRATKTMLTEVQLTNRNLMLRPGMLVNAHIGLEKKDNALLLPVGALIKEKLNTSLFIVSSGIAKKVPVKTGFDDGTSIEISEGLKGDETVILPGGQSLRNDQLIRFKEARGR
jgi:membrane fusion protein (multidrug efflux system)